MSKRINNIMLASHFAEHLSQFEAVLKAAQWTQGKDAITPLAGEGAWLEMLSQLAQHHGEVFVLGNGGSAAIAAHVANDLTNVSGVHADALQNMAELTCHANDYGYDQAYARLLSHKMHPNDILLAISSSGKSINLLNAVTMARQKGAKVLTFTGFSPDNPLRQLGDLNLWLDCRDYGIVEVGHQLLLHYLSDRLGVMRR
jgi:D-sedoheptulose 7-phosphate isomerase